MARFVDQSGRQVARSLASAVAGALLMGALACSSGSDDSKSNAGTGGRAGSGSAGASGGSGGSSGSGSSTGGTLTAGSGGDAGEAGSMTSSGGSTSTGGTMASTGGTMASTGGSTSTGGNAGGPGTQPLGSICSFDTQCSQADGEVVCCKNTCTLGEACPTDPLYLPCESTPDCEAYGGGRLCCEVTAGGEVTRFCTKRSGCSGRVLP